MSDVTPTVGCYDSLEDLLAAIRQFDMPPKEAIKPVSLGGRQFSSINPQWRADCLTSLFGPYGIGWRTESTAPERIVHAEGTESIIVRLQLLAYPTIAGKVVELKTGWHTGGTPNTKSAHDAAKMSETDALGKACSLLGIGAAIYRGEADDDKYQRMEKARAQRPSQPRNAPAPKINWREVAVKGKSKYAGRLWGDMLVEDPQFCAHARDQMYNSRQKNGGWATPEVEAVFTGLSIALKGKL